VIDKAAAGADMITGVWYSTRLGPIIILFWLEKHGVPFYVAAPLSTFDLKHTEGDIIVEERSPEEVCSLGCVQLAPEGIRVHNPAFDATPLELVSEIVTENGVFKPPMMPKI